MGNNNSMRHTAIALAYFTFLKKRTLLNFSTPYSLIYYSKSHICHLAIQIKVSIIIN